jgi:hypothetical protein
MIEQKESSVGHHWSQQNDSQSKDVPIQSIIRIPGLSNWVFWLKRTPKWHASKEPPGF